MTESTPTSQAELSAEVRLHIPFHDCDPMQIVWHGNYLKYFELARTELFQRLDLDVPQIRALGVTMFVSETHCRYLFPLRYNDEVEVRARITRIDAIVRVSYAVMNLTHQRKSARAYTELAFCNPDGDLLHTLPEVIRERMV